MAPPADTENWIESVVKHHSGEVNTSDSSCTHPSEILKMEIKRTLRIGVDVGGVSRLSGYYKRSVRRLTILPHRPIQIVCF